MPEWWWTVQAAKTLGMSVTDLEAHPNYNYLVAVALAHSGLVAEFEEAANRSAR